MEQFIYDSRKDEQANFQHWRYLNDQEREEFGEPKLDDQEAKQVFGELKRNGWLIKQSDEARAGRRRNDQS